MNDSRWYYGVLVVAALELVGFAIIAAAGTDGAALAAGFVGVALVVVAILMLPVFGLCLYLDARAVRESAESWDPNPVLWAVGGSLLQVVGLAAGSTLYTFVTVVYLFRRFRSSPAAVADEDAWAEQEAEWDDEGTV